MDVATSGLEGVREASDVGVEVVDHAHARVVGALPERLDVRQRLPRCRAVAVEPRGRDVERPLGVLVPELQARNLAEPRRRLPKLSHPLPPRQRLAHPTQLEGGVPPSTLVLDDTGEMRTCL